MDDRRYNFKVRPLRLTAFAVALVVIVVTIVLSAPRATDKTRVEKWLGVKLPQSVSAVHFWYDQAPGSYQARLYCRFQLPRDEFLVLMSHSRFQEEGTNSWTLPINLPTRAPIMWWDPPAVQTGVFAKRSGGESVAYLWCRGYVYVEKIGGFGSLWGPHATIHN
jgi:hypothetical protein